MYVAAAVLLTGCSANPGPNPPPVAPSRPHQGAKLTVACPDAALAAALNPLARGWASRTGAAVDIAPRPFAAGDDVGVLPLAEVGAWAERGDLLPVPATLRAADNPYQWSGVFGVYAGPLTGWGGQAVGVPVAGDGAVLVYRSDRLADPKVIDAFRQKFGRPPVPPATWEDVAELADAVSAADGRPSLPALPAADGPLADLFFRIAACYDRPADPGKGADAAGANALSFQFRVDTAKPRVGGPAFAAAAGWLARTRAVRPPTGPDPVAALSDGSAAVALLSLADLARLPKTGGAVPARFALAPCPGTRSYFAGGKPVPAAAGVNYIPYFAGGRVLAVRKGCPHPDAAFELLAELAGPAGSDQVISATTPGAGPFRNTHTDAGRLVLWLGYGFDPERSRGLLAAMKAFVAPAVPHPTFTLRGPDQAELTAALAVELRRTAAAVLTPEEAVKKVAEAWTALDAKHNPEELLRWRRRAVGLP